MSVRRRGTRRVITAQEVEAKAHSGGGEIEFDPETTIVTPLARERANDLGVALRPHGSVEAPQHRGSPARAGAATAGSANSSKAGSATDAEELSPTIVAEVIRRVQQRLGR
jgi:hypothetical protein